MLHYSSLSKRCHIHPEIVIWHEIFCLTSSYICITLILYQYPFLVSYVCILDSTWIVTWDKAIMSWWWNLWTTEGHILRWCPLSTPCPDCYPKLQLLQHYWFWKQIVLWVCWAPMHSETLSYSMSLWHSTRMQQSFSLLCPCSIVPRLVLFNHRLSPVSLG